MTLPGNARCIVLFIRSLLLAGLILAVPATSSASIVFSVVFAPPPLPVYEQPFCPGEGYLWVPGYWAYDDAYGYFWVPGTWVLVPEPGLLWTPGYWGWSDGVFLFHQGYWGPRVGFYGGIVYGFGYTGFGYDGGYWNNGAFFYNRSVNRVTNITNVYNRTVVNNITVNNVSYNGGVGGVSARPTPQEEAAMRDRRIPPTAMQSQHLQAASTNRQLYESANRGKPPIAATVKPAEFRGHGVVAARAAARGYVPPPARTVGRPGAGNALRSVARIHPNDIPPTTRPSFSNTGNPKLDRKYQQEQAKLQANQEKERRKLQQQQEQEHQRMARRSANDARRQQIEQKHQQETRRLEQRQVSEQQRLQERQQSVNRNPGMRERR